MPTAVIFIRLSESIGAVVRPRRAMCVCAGSPSGASGAPERNAGADGGEINAARRLTPKGHPLIAPAAAHWLASPGASARNADSALAMPAANLIARPRVPP